MLIKDKDERERNQNKVKTKLWWCCCQSPGSSPGFWFLVIGYWFLVFGYWLLVIGYCLLSLSFSCASFCCVFSFLPSSQPKSLSKSKDNKKWSFIFIFTFIFFFFLPIYTFFGSQSASRALPENSHLLLLEISLSHVIFLLVSCYCLLVLWASICFIFLLGAQYKVKRKKSTRKHDHIMN